MLVAQKNIPARGFSRFAFCLKESFQVATEEYAEMYRNNVACRLEKTPLKFLAKISPKTVVLSTAFAAAAATAYFYPQQALGLYGFGVSYLATRMKENRNMRSMYAASCPLFGAQYALDIQNGLAGVISATSGTLRGALLTAIPDNETKKRKLLAYGFAMASAGSVAAISLYRNEYQNLIILPGFALSAAADYMGDRKSHTARTLKFGALATVLSYDAFVSGNLGSGLSSLLLMYQTAKTAAASGDFDSHAIEGGNTLDKVRSYLKSLTIDK